MPGACIDAFVGRKISLSCPPPADAYHGRSACISTRMLAGKADDGRCQAGVGGGEGVCGCLGDAPG